ncbi:MAG: hypothetical protein F9K24_20750 [Leptonema illini]|uniref:Uncharacterized protein n=1 Tax=Leptonema illini TaxID=183 RepID=A0A833GXP9_9LEPT|nr:MAG: hypothetical protein F9K24_20750 [Leptonema illini]
MATYYFRDRSDAAKAYSMLHSSTYEPGGGGLYVYRNGWPSNYILVGHSSDYGVDRYYVTVAGNIILADGYAVPVPALGPNQGAIFQGANEADGYWQIVPDYRGQTWYRKDTASPYVIQQLGFDPTTDLNLTDAVPPSDIGMAPVWDADNDEWTLVEDHRGEVWFDKNTAQRIVIAAPGAIPINLIDVAPHREAGSGYAPDRWNATTEEWNAYVYYYNPLTGEYVSEGLVAYGPDFSIPENSTQVLIIDFDMNRERTFSTLSQQWSYGEDLRGKRFKFAEFKYLYRAAAAASSQIVSGSLSMVQSMLSSIADRLASKADADHTHSIDDLPVAAYEESDPNKLVRSNDPRLNAAGGHADRHRTGGEDELTPAMIGAPTTAEAQAMADAAKAAAVAQILGGAAPETLDTILEIANALLNNPDVITTLQTIQGAHVADVVKHITPEERAAWNAAAGGVLPVDIVYNGNPALNDTVTAYFPTPGKYLLCVHEIQAPVETLYRGVLYQGNSITLTRHYQTGDTATLIVDGSQASFTIFGEGDGWMSLKITAIKIGDYEEP